MDDIDAGTDPVGGTGSGPRADATDGGGPSTRGTAAGGVVVRAYRPQDLDALHDVCLRTGATGADASGLTDHPRLIGEVWAAPYAVFAPELVSVLVLGAGDPERPPGDDVVGYVLGVRDTRAFDAWAAASWWPAVRARYRDVEPVTELDTGLLAGVRAGTYRSDLPDDLLERYPAHLHVDLLPQVQGGGWGRTLLHRLFAQLTAAGVPGVHLGVAEENTGARAFYARLGFVELSSSPGGRTLGLSLPVT